MRQSGESAFCQCDLGGYAANHAPLDSGVYSPATVDIVFESLRFLINEGLTVYFYVNLENHLDLIDHSQPFCCFPSSPVWETYV